MRKAAVLIADVSPLARLQRQFVQLRHLPFQPLAFLQDVFGIAFEFLARAPHRLPAAVRIGHRLRLQLQAGLVIQQLALRIGAQQRLMRVLAMNIDQQLAQFTQLRRGRCTAVDEGTRTAGVVNHATQQHVAFFTREFGGGQPRGDRIASHKIGTDFGARSAFAHHAGIAARAQCQRQCVNQNRFAGAGFAGQHTETGAEFQLDGFDNDKITNAEKLQHIGFLGRPLHPSFSRSMR